MRMTTGILIAGLAWPIAAAPADLTGTWTAMHAERDGAAAAELVGHRLSFAGDRFEIAASDGRLLYAGTYQVDAAAQPARIDFVNDTGEAAGVTWEGIYRFDRQGLTIVDDAPDPSAPRPSAFAAGKGSGYVLLEFAR
jgi:uncharacterized protein (TIGR03067 family)